MLRSLVQILKHGVWLWWLMGKSAVAVISHGEHLIRCTPRENPGFLHPPQQTYREPVLPVAERTIEYTPSAGPITMFSSLFLVFSLAISLVAAVPRPTIRDAPHGVERRR